MSKHNCKLHNFNDKWRSLSIKDKIGVLLGTSILAVSISLVVTIILLMFSSHNFKKLLDDNISCYRYVEAIKKEDQEFRQYTKYRTEENEKSYEKAVNRTQAAIDMLPFDYSSIGASRYSKTWNIRSAYEEYSKLKKKVLELSISDVEYIDELYRAYKINDYLIEYGNGLIGETLSDSAVKYQDMVKQFYIFPVIIFVLAFIYFFVGKFLNKIINDSVSEPVYKLSEASERIARNDYDFPDIEIENRDELYMLSVAFNKMKNSAKDYINTLEEKNIIAEQLHREEMEKLEVEQQLESLNFELLKSQVNPHFLFNTLNMISCNARLENAPVTAQMTISLGELFRYSLRTRQSLVILSRELNMLEQYIYIQKMRFGDRMEFEVNCNVDRETVMLPPFTLQPIVENSIIHGIRSKEEGGIVRIDIFKNDKGTVIDISDNGKGMSAERLNEVNESIKLKKTSNVGIGIGNIYKLFKSRYGENCEFEIRSKENIGTKVHLLIPEERQNEAISNINSR